MTDRAQFEAMLNALINEDQDAAKEIFHNIVVAKSREIYEELLESDFAPEQEEEEEVDEMFGSEEESEEEESPFGDEEEEESEEEESPFGDEEDEAEEGDMEDRVMDLEDALEDLKAEFEQLLAGEEHEEENEPGIHGDMHSMGDDEEEVDEFAGLMEYTQKVPTAKMGDNGANAKSSVAGKNDMGGTTANIAKNFSTEKGGTQGGLLNPASKEENFGNLNTAKNPQGGKAFSTKVPAGHGAEKKGARPNDDRGADSLLNGVKSRAK